MKGFWLALAIVAALSPAAASASNPIARQGEAKLAKLIDGRTAGQPVGCIDTPYRLAGGGMQVIDGVGVVYDAGKTIFVARLIDSKMLRRTDRLDVSRAVSTRLCVSDRMVARDRATGVQTGPVFLKDFVPYTKVG
jgi:hypothetical protein